VPFEDLEELHYIISIASKGVLSLTQSVITEEQLERRKRGTHPIIGYLIKDGRKDYSGKDRKYGFNIS